MQDVVEALRDLTEVNKQLVTKLDEIREVITLDIETRKNKEKLRRHNYIESDIEFLMWWKKNWTREKALEMLEQYNYDIVKILYEGHYGPARVYNLQQTLNHYEHKKNLAVINMW